MLPLASSRDTSNGPDWRDVAQAFLYLEKLTGGKVSLRAELRPTSPQDSIVWIADLWLENLVNGGPKHLGSASVSMLTRGGGGTDAALLLLAYELDKDIYRRSEGLGPKTA